MASCMKEGGYSKMEDNKERGAALAQTCLHQFSADVDKMEGGVPVARPGLYPHIPVPAPSPPCSQPQALPPPGTSPHRPGQLKGCQWSFPTGLKTPSPHSS